MAQQSKIVDETEGLIEETTDIVQGHKEPEKLPARLWNTFAEPEEHPRFLAIHPLMTRPNYDTTLAIIRSDQLRHILQAGRILRRLTNANYSYASISIPELEKDAKEPESLVELKSSIAEWQAEEFSE